jgi:zinc protease
VTDGTPLASVEAALLEEIERVRREGIEPRELAKANAQLKARLVFDTDSVTNIAHQIGYFDTIGGAGVFKELPSRLANVTIDQVADVARTVLTESNRTIGWFDPA